MNIVSFRNQDQQETINRLKALQSVHDNVLEKMFSELGSKFQRKEISDRFWDALPADIKSKYKGTVSNIRSKMREIIMMYPQYFEQYRRQNKPYFQKLENQRRRQEEQQMDSTPEELVQVNR